MAQVHKHAAAKRDLLDRFVYLAENAGLDIAERFVRRVDSEDTKSETLATKDQMSVRCGALSDRVVLPKLSVPKTVEKVIVHHADRLHIRINDGRTDEAESPVLEILTQHVGFERGRRNLPHCLPPVELGSSIHETPAVGVKASELFLNFEKRPGVAHRGFDFHTVPNDRRIQCELLNPSPCIPRHSFRIELAEGMAITLLFPKHKPPTESGLGAFEHQKLKVLTVIVDWNTPFAIVILEQQRIVYRRPCTSRRSHKPPMLQHFKP